MRVLAISDLDEAGTPDPVLEFRAALRSAGGVVISSPECGIAADPELSAALRSSIDALVRAIEGV